MENSLASLVSATPQLCFYQGRYYPLKGQECTLTLPIELASSAISAAIPFLPTLQNAAMVAEATMASLVVEVGPYTLVFSRQVQAAASLALLAQLQGASPSDEALLGLPCMVYLRAAPAMPVPPFASYSMIQAFADGRYRAASGSDAPCPQIFKLSGPTKVKSPPAERKAFQQLFLDIPPSSRWAWDAFAAWLDTDSAMRSTGTMTDSWLLRHLHEHEWLGNAWREDGEAGGPLVLVSGTSVPNSLGRAVHMKPSLNIALSGRAAVPFFPPSWPEGSLDIIRAALLSAVAPAALLLMSAELPVTLLTPDPLELDYPINFTL
jgi:hypothetical protein